MKKQGRYVHYTPTQAIQNGFGIQSVLEVVIHMKRAKCFSNRRVEQIYGFQPECKYSG
jgi:hypothetical protein